MQYYNLSIFFDCPTIEFDHRGVSPNAYCKVFCFVFILLKKSIKSIEE